MKNLLVTTWLMFSLALASPASAEGSLFRLFDKELLSAAVSVAAETVVADLFNDDADTGDTDSTAEIEVTPHDPPEKYNRMMFNFNMRLDEKALKPIAESYVEYTPSIVRAGVRNFFSNLGDVGVAANSALQGKVEQAMSDSSRLALNSVVGLGGLFDVASKVDLEKNNEDFGQTLGVWGVPEGPYIVLPLLGPRTMRSAFGTALDTYLQMETLGAVGQVSGVDSISELVALGIVDQRTELLGKEELLQQVALDPYVFARESYLAYRRCQVDDCDKIDYVAADPETRTATESEEMDLLDQLDELDQLDDLEEE